MHSLTGPTLKLLSGPKLLREAAKSNPNLLKFQNKLQSVLLLLPSSTRQQKKLCNRPKGVAIPTSCFNLFISLVVSVCLATLNEVLTN
jgi:hypothetical protein